jgi:transposase InsO family protein
MIFWILYTLENNQANVVQYLPLLSSHTRQYHIHLALDHLSPILPLQAVLKYY